MLFRSLLGSSVALFTLPTLALAQGAAAAPVPAGGIAAQMLPLVLIFIVFWVLLIRPQQRKMKEHKAMIAALKKGDTVITSGGIKGTVKKIISDVEVGVEIAPNVEITVIRGTIAEVINPQASASASTPPAKDNHNKKAA